MAASYLKHAWRAISHNRRYMLISMVGLVLSLAGAVIIARYLHSELTVNQYIPDLDRTMTVYHTDNGIKLRDALVDVDSRMPWNSHNRPVDDKDVEAFTQFYTYDNSFITTDDAETTMNVIVADTAFFDILPRTLADGTWPQKEFEAVVTKKLARRMWPAENPIGKSMSMYSDNSTYTVVGVVDPMPTKGHFDFDALFVRDLGNYMSAFTGWAICRVRRGASIDSINARSARNFEVLVNDAHVNNYKQYMKDNRLMPLADVYFDSSFYRMGDDPLNPVGNRHNLTILEIVAWLLILIGLFNFLNIYSIVMITRSHGFAVRKTFGAGRVSIFLHILIENALVITLAMLLAWGIIALVSPLMSNYFEIEQVASSRFDILLSVAIVVVFSLVVSAVSSFSIWHRAKVHSMGNSDSRFAIVLRRYLLLMPQMALTLIIISLSVYFMRQLHYMLHADMGFATENILSFKLRPQQGLQKVIPEFRSDQEWEDYQSEWLELAQTSEMAMTKIKEMPEVLAVAPWPARDLPSLTYARNNTSKMRNADKPDVWATVNLLYLSSASMDVFQVKVTEGEVFTEHDYGNSNPYKYSLIANRQFVHQLGITDISTQKALPEHRIWFSVGDDTDNVPYQIIGVADNLRINPLSEEEMPIVILDLFGDSGTAEGKPIIRYNPAQKAELLEKLTRLYQEINGEDAEPEFEYSEDYMQQVYAKEKRTARIYAAFAILAIFISCLGLYGVMAYDMQRRSREFMIRRVQGAKPSDLTKLATKPYAATLLLASVIAAVASCLAINEYQTHYSDYVSQQPWGLLGGILIIALIGYVTIRRHVDEAYKQEYKHD